MAEDWAGLMRGLAQHSWDQSRPRYTQTTGAGSALLNAISTDMSRDTPFATLSKHNLRGSRIGALRQARQEGLNPMQGEKYYERMFQLLQEAGDYDGASRAYKRSVAARAEHDQRLASEGARPLIGEAAAAEMKTKIQNLPESVHRRNMELEKEKARHAAESYAARGGTSTRGTGSGRGVTEVGDVSTADRINATRDLASTIVAAEAGDQNAQNDLNTLYAQHPGLKDSIEGNREYFGLGGLDMTNVFDTLEKDPRAFGAIDSRARQTLEFTKTFPNMMPEARQRLMQELNQGYVPIRHSEHGEVYQDRRTNELYRLSPDGEIQKIVGGMGDPSAVPSGTDASVVEPSVMTRRGRNRGSIATVQSMEEALGFESDEGAEAAMDILSPVFQFMQPAGESIIQNPQQTPESPIVPDATKVVDKISKPPARPIPEQKAALTAAKARTEKWEGPRRFIYPGPNGHWTIGVGHLVLETKKGASLEDRLLQLRGVVGGRADGHPFHGIAVYDSGEIDKQGNPLGDELIGGKFLSKTQMSDMFDRDWNSHAKRAQASMKGTKGVAKDFYWDKLTPELKYAITDATFRGAWAPSKSPNTIRKLKQALIDPSYRKFKEAADEWLNHGEYLRYKNAGIDNSITERMELVADEIMNVWHRA